MSREVQIPILLWITAAIVVHAVGGGGVDEVAKIAIDRAELRALVRSVRDTMHPADTTFELMLEDSEPMAQPKVASPENAPENASENSDPPKDEESEPEAAPEKAPKPEKAPPPPLPEKEKAPPPPPPPPPPKPEEPIAKAEPPPPAPPPPPPPLPPQDHRLAIKQNVEKNQLDNTNASRIADDANHTAEETMARIRSHDQDEPDPTLGKSHAGPKDEVGDSDENKVADSEDKKGDIKHAPGEAARVSTAPTHNAPPPPAPAPVVAKAPPPPSAPGGKSSGANAPKAPSPPASPPPVAGGAGPTSPEVHAAEGGSYSLDPANPGGDGKSRIAGKRRKTTAFKNPVRVGSLGLGSAGVPGGHNLNLTMAGVEAAVGQDKLKAERAADGAARRSKHRGAFETNKFERWRAAIENYDPSVKLGNQTSLNAARVPFGTYINHIHNRLHPIFAEEFLAALDDLPHSNPLNPVNQDELVTHLEIVINKDEGRIVRMGVTRASGVTAFDVVALNSVNRAQPFGKAPDVIVSPDGNVYLHWEFHRNPFDACTTRNAQPKLLKEAPVVKTPTRPPRKVGPYTDDKRGPGPLLPLRER